MRTEIYYFSGTGNSLAIAKDIAEKTGGSLIPIAAIKEKKSIASEAEVIGIVFPVYYGELPVIVKEFAEKLENLNGKYVFAVSNYGGAASVSIRQLKRIIRSNGGELSAAYGIQMPQNSFYKPKENQPLLFSECKKKIDLIVSNISKKTRGIFYTNALLELVIMPVQPVFIRPICRKAFLKQTNLPAESKLDDLIRMLDKNFVSNDKCNGCGICSKVCPADNIKIEDNKPVWLHHCETCLACYNWCPNKAIEGGITNDYFYRHPDIKINEIIKQKGEGIDVTN
ncbi:MAG: EFR1 family ferrodoxin [Bacillota bacterium]